MIQLRRALAVLAGALTLALAPSEAVGRDADAVFEGDPSVLLPRADHLVATADVHAGDFHTGGSRFDGEWALMTHVMAMLAWSQITRAHPELLDRYRAAMARSTAALLEPAARAFATSAWSSDALDALDDPAPRDAWLCYVAVALSSRRLVDASFEPVALHDRMLASLQRRIERRRDRMIETYPGEAYPADVSACIAAIALDARRRGDDATAFVASWADTIAAAALDPSSGYLAQSLHGGRAGPARGSGTALVAYFLGLAGSPLARMLWESGLSPGERTLAGFGAIREHGTPGSGGDIDSGPVVLGVSVSATGFSLGVARQHGARDAFARLHRTACLFGVPYASERGAGFVTGGPLGDAILLAMETAAPVAVGP
jgi:hypothetical protein